jgi:hypothetical protein
MPKHNFTIQTRQKSEILVQSDEAIAPLATFESAVRKVDGYSAISILVTGVRSIQVRVEEACTEDGTFGLTGTLASTLDPISGLYVVCERFATCGAFAKFYIDNLDPVAESGIDACISGVPVGAGSGSGAGVLGPDTRAATFVVGPDHADYPMTEAGLLAAIAALPAAGGEIYIREGTVVITAPIVLPDKGVTIRGSNTLASVLSFTFAGALFYDNFDKGRTFSDLKITGNDSAGQICFDVGAGQVCSYDYFIDRVTISDVRKMVRIDAAGYLCASFTNSNWQGVGGADYIWWDGPGYAVFRKCYISAGTGYGGTLNTAGNSTGFAVSDSSIGVRNGATFDYIDIVNSSVTGNPAAGEGVLSIPGVGGGLSKILGTLFNGCSLSVGGICSIVGNQFLTAGMARSLDVTSSARATVVGNDFSGYSSEAVRIAASNCRVVGNFGCKVLETGAADNNIYGDNSGFSGSTIIGPLSLVDNQQTRKTTTTPYTVVATDRTLLIDATAGAKTVNLPTTASSKWRILDVKKIDASANTVTIDGSGAETIDGALTKVIAFQYNSLTIQSDGTEWWVL